MPSKPPVTVAGIATGLVSIAAALIALAFCVVVPLQAQQAARLGADSGRSVPCAVSTLCTCQSNEKQLGQALVEYSQDFDEKFPPGTQQSSVNPGLTGVGWAGEVYPYVKSPAPFKCPNDSTTATAPYYPVSYALNSNIPGLSQAVFSDASSTPELFEISGDQVQLAQYDEGASLGAKSFSAAGNGTDRRLYSGLAAALEVRVVYATGTLGNRPKTPVKPSQEPGVTGRHSGGSNFVFVDGHAHWFLPGDVSSGTDALSVDGRQTGHTNGSAAGLDTPPYQATFSID